LGPADTAALLQQRLLLGLLLLLRLHVHFS
jgi:hypothetical protein